MKTSIVSLLGFALVAATPAAASAQWAFYGSPGGLGAVGGGVDCFPRKIYDRESGETITLAMIRKDCPAGYMRGESLDTGRTWRVAFASDGSMSGVDEDGARWRYNPRAKLFTNLATGRSCPRSTPRHVCPARS